MKVKFDLRTLKIETMENATLNIGKNWIVTRPPSEEGEGKKADPPPSCRTENK